MKGKMQRKAETQERRVYKREQEVRSSRQKGSKFSPQRSNYTIILSPGSRPCQKTNVVSFSSNIFPVTAAKTHSFSAPSHAAIKADQTICQGKSNISPSFHIYYKISLMFHLILLLKTKSVGLPW